MNVDQLRRAADEAAICGDVHAAVARVLRAAAEPHRDLTGLHYRSRYCRKRISGAPDSGCENRPCVGCAIDDVAAAYLGEEPQL